MGIKVIQNANTGEKYEAKNLDFLPLFYLIPYEMIHVKSNLVGIPRNPKLAVMVEHWRNVISSDEFLSTLFDCVSFYVWSAFDINPYIHCFSGEDPLFLLANDLNMWIDAYNDLYYSIDDMLKNMPITELIPFPTEDQAKDVFNRIGTRGIIKNNLQPVIDCVKQHRCHEDYDKRMSNPKKDFYRKWNHSRAIVKVVSIEELMKKAELKFSSDEEYYSLIDQIVEYNNLNSEHEVIYKMDLERYINRLDDKDTEILALKYSGYTQNEIAEKLGYRTHSAVGKRISGCIRREYFNYFAWMPGLK